MRFALLTSLLLALFLGTAAQIAGKPAVQPPPQKVVDPIALLRDQGVELSVLGPDGKKLDLPPHKKAVVAVSVLLERAKSYSFTLSVRGVDKEVRVAVQDLPGKERNVLKSVAKDQWQADRWYGNRVVPLIVSNAFTMAKEGDVRLVVMLDKEIVLELSSASAADGIFALQALGLAKPFAPWIDKVVPKNSEDVVILEAGDRLIPELPSSKLGAKPEPAGKEQWKPVIEAAQAKYNEKRAELMKRMSRSYLYYAPKNDIKSWSVTRAGVVLFVCTGCSDRMFVASFELEFRLEQGKWKYVKLHAAEWFKGE